MVQHVPMGVNLTLTGNRSTLFNVSNGNHSEVQVFSIKLEGDPLTLIMI